MALDLGGPIDPKARLEPHRRHGLRLSHHVFRRRTYDAQVVGLARGLEHFDNLELVGTGKAALGPLVFTPDPKTHHEVLTHVFPDRIHDFL